MEKLTEVLNYSIVEQAELGVLSKRNNLKKCTIFDDYGDCPNLSCSD
ncbi:hypothetical protein OL548_14755 [Lysinibacillus sp. MHQ-1]|nr:hypothetical protein OL548_14755 [Lysinibacillus sp. MHQ-1]